MSISIVNASIEILKGAFDAIYAADGAIAHAEGHLGSQTKSLAGSKAIATAISKVVVAGQKLPLIVPAFAEIEKVLNAQHRVILDVTPDKHNAANYENGKPMPFLCDYDVVPAKMIFGNVIRVYVDTASRAPASSTPAARDATSALVQGVRGAWAPLKGRFTSFLSAAGAASSASNTFGCNLALLETITIPEIFRISQTNNANAAPASGGVFARDGGAGDVLLSVGVTAQQSAIITAQHEPLRRELEALEYSFGVAKTRLTRELNEQSASLRSSEIQAQIVARRAIHSARALFATTGLHLIDYHCRLGRFSDVQRYVGGVDGEIQMLDSLKPLVGGASVEAQLSDEHYNLLAPIKYPAMLAKLLVYHTFHTDNYVHIASQSVKTALSTAQQLIRGGSAGRKAADGSTANERFAKAVHAYESLYAGSKNGSVLALGVPMPRYGLADKEDTKTADVASSSPIRATDLPTSAYPLPIPISSLSFEGSQLLADLNLQSAFNPLCSPLFSIADYTLLVVAEFYTYVYEVAVGRNRSHYLLDASSFTNKTTVDNRRKLFHSAMDSIRKLRVEDLTSAQYDCVKSLMFGQFRLESIHLAQMQTLANQKLQQQQQQHVSSPTSGGEAAAFPTSPPTSGAVDASALEGVAITYTDSSPVMCEIARISAVLCLSCLSRDEVKANYLSLPEVQALLSVEAEATHDVVEALVSSNSITPATNPATGKKISTAARAIVQGCYNTNYSDAMIGLTSAPLSLFGDFFAKSPILSELIPHCQQDIRESIIRRLLQPYATISIGKIAEQLSMGGSISSASEDNATTKASAVSDAASAQLMEELKGMILHGKLGPSVRIDYQNKAIVRLQRSYGNTTKRQKGSSADGGGDQHAASAKLDEAILLVADRLRSEVGVSHTRATERLLRIASLRATRMDDPPKSENKKHSSAKGGGNADGASGGHGYDDGAGY